MRDTVTSTEADAGRFERGQAYEVDDREHNEPGTVPEHDCTAPDPERCLVCVLDAVIAEQRAAR